MIGRYGASVGKVLKGKFGAYNVALVKTVPNPSIVDRQFFYHYLTSRLFQDYLAKTALRSAQDGFSKDDIFGFPVPVPELREQRIIVDKLNRLAKETERLESVYEHKLAALAALKKSLLHQAFSGNL